jgi:hypothetical protein
MFKKKTFSRNTVVIWALLILISTLYYVTPILSSEYYYCDYFAIVPPYETCDGEDYVECTEDPELLFLCSLKCYNYDHWEYLYCEPHPK